MKKSMLRIFVVLLFLVPLLSIGSFYEHFSAYMSGNILRDVVNQQWHVVAFNILIFMAFLIPLSYRRKAKWNEYGMVGAFFVSLFIEMYGIPLSIMFASNYFSSSAAINPPILIGFEFLGVRLGMDIGMAYGAVMMVFGMALIVAGWLTLYKNAKKGLVTNGLYSYSRHPQYLGFILITLGWFIAWPTFLTLLFTPVLVYKYLSVSKKEEQEVSKEFPSYKNYKANVPFLI
jgi:methanethiol S-methyltransferase